MAHTDCCAGKIDRKRVSAATEAAALYWCARLRTDRESLCAAIAAVGDGPEAVGTWLDGQGRCRLIPSPRPGA